MSLYAAQKLLFHLNREPAVQQRFRASRETVLDDYELSAEEREAFLAGDIGKLYVLGANGQLLMHFAALLGMPWADYIEAMREGGTWSYEVFCEPKNVCVSITDHHIPHWGA